MAGDLPSLLLWQAGHEHCRSRGLREAVAKRPSPLEDAGGY
jgi:hypothetical protein